MGKAEINTQALKRRWLVRGESLVASTGLTVAAVLLLAVGSSTWWTVEALGQRDVESARADARRLSTVVARSVEPLFAADETSAMRRVVMESARVDLVRACRVVLPDGTIIADSDPSRIDPGEVPDVWAGAAGEAGEELIADGRFLVIRQPIDVTGRGAAVCEIEFAMSDVGGGSPAVRGGAVLSGVIGLVLMLAVYRRFRARLGAIGAVREALISMTKGESDTESLLIDESFGPEAAAWNILLGEREELRRRDLRDRAEMATSGPASGRNERSLCDLLSDGVVVVSETGEVTYANGAAAVLLSAPLEELIGGVLSGPLAEAEVRTAIVEAARTRSRRRDVIDVEVGDEGECVLRVSVRGARNLPDGAVVVTIEDVTQLKLAEQSRNSFVAQATHELRTPLTNIRLYVEQLVDEGEEDAALRARAINVINQEARRLERIVGDMLSVSEMEAGSIALRSDDVRLDQLFDSLQMDYVAQATDKHIALKFEMPPKIPVIQGDRDKICLALHNLISNALKYTPDGGAVTVRVGVAPDETVSVEVRDTGIGIAPEQAEKVFERFFRADDARVGEITGSGIGLALAREVARLHGGDITVDSVLDEGSTFTLTIPGAERPSRAA